MFFEREVTMSGMEGLGRKLDAFVTDVGKALPKSKADVKELGGEVGRACAKGMRDIIQYSAKVPDKLKAQMGTEDVKIKESLSNVKVDKKSVGEAWDPAKSVLGGVRNDIKLKWKDLDVCKSFGKLFGLQ